MNDLDSVSISVIEETVTPTGLTLLIENQTDEEFNHDEAYELVVDWEWLYGSLDSGEYRIIKQMLSIYEPGNYERIPLATEFSIK